MVFIYNIALITHVRTSISIAATAELHLYWQNLGLVV